MEFEWDEDKRLSNLEKHGFDFQRAELLFDGRASLTQPAPHSLEVRFSTTAYVDDRFMTAIWTHREEKIRRISVRSSEMRRSGTIVSYTAEELRAMRARGEDLTDWARLNAMTEEELEASIDKEDEGDFEGAVGFPGIPGIKRETTLLIDDQVIQWFRLQGADYLARMNDVLLSYVIEQREKPH